MGEVECLQRAARQSGVLSRTQALEHLSRQQVSRRLMAGRWALVFPGVYRVEGAPPDWRQRYRALALALGPQFVFSHRSAAMLHGLRGFGAEPLEVSSPRQVRLPGVLAHRAPGLTAKDVAAEGGFHVTSATRTVLDLATVVSADELRLVADQALSQRLTTVPRLGATLERLAGHRGVAAVRALLRVYEGGDGPTESELEARVVALVEESGLPTPVRQRGVVVAGRVRRLDFCWPDRRVVLEADGYAWHAGLEAFERDRRRNNALVARGFKVLHWTWQGLRERPAELIHELAGVLAR